MPRKYQVGFDCYNNSNEYTYIKLRFTVRLFHLPLHIPTASLLQRLYVKYIRGGQNCLNIIISYIQLRCIRIVDDKFHGRSFKAIHSDLGLFTLSELIRKHCIKVITE